jgi:SAM-dependent methyltransferase
VRDTAADPPGGAPSHWLVANRGLLPTAGRALDVACGRGRHTLWLAEQGFTVTAVDRDEDCLDALAQQAARRGLSAHVRTHRVDLESGAPSIDRDSFDVIVVVHYLHRPLLPALVAALRGGGALVYETFTTAQAARGKPTNPDFLLRPGEVVTLVQPLEILNWREGTFDERDLASVVARKPPAR